MSPLLRALPQQAPALVMGASAGALLFAFVAQYRFGLEPCVLCLYQRWPYAATMILGAFAVGRPEWLRPWLLGLAGLVFLAGGGLAAYHVGVEQHWWAGTAECTGANGAQTVEELRAQLRGRQPARCDEAAFVFLGLSMAGWNLVLSLALAAMSFAGVRHERRSGAPA